MPSCNVSNQSPCIAANPEFDDPKQGAALSCNLIAALSSVAWVCWSRIITSYTLKFFPLPRPPVPVYGPQITVNNQFWMEGAVLLNASGSDGCLWPAIYEKAYIKEKSGTDYCDVSQAATGLWPSPINALQALTEWAPTTRTIAAGDPFTTIRGKCDAAYSYKTKNPMVAWTLDAFTDPNYPPSRDQMRIKHCYSVLGTMVSGGKNYIVLRNPRGVSEGTTDVNVLTSGPGLTFAANGNFEYLNGTRNAARYCSKNAPLNVANNGVFAIDNTAFKKYFAGYGWTGA